MKGIIVAAGLGTRFFPITKTIPKEMLPIINKPSIEYIVDEFINSGIKDIILISSKRKLILEEYFNKDSELENELREREELLKLIKPKNINIEIVRQEKPLGTGHALLKAKPLLSREPVIVAYPDDLHIGEKPLSLALIEKYRESGKNVLSVLKNPINLNRYGVIKLAEDKIHVKDIVEKPSRGSEPSNMASIGRFLYTFEFFEHLEEGFNIHREGEYYHTYALKKLMEKNMVVYKEIEGERLDTGDINGYIESIIKVAKKDEKLLKIIEKALKV